MAASAVQFVQVGAKPQFSKQFNMRRTLPHACCIDVSEGTLQKEFHEMFRMPVEKKKADKKNKKKAKNLKERRKFKQSKIADVQPWRAPVLEIRGNPSPFAVFTNVRQCILVKHLRDSACYFYWASLTSHRGSTDSDSDTEHDGGAEGANDEPRSISKMVGIGLCSMFELMRESRMTQPTLCLAVLRALLDVLQGQQPEGFRTEPPEVIDKLYDLLLDLATATPPVLEAPHTSDTEQVLSQLTSYACACLLSLVVAKGDTAKLLGATSSLLMSPRSLTLDEIPTPNILIALQKSVQAVLLGKTRRPDWLTHGVPWAAHCQTFSLKIPKLPGTAKSASSISLPQCFITLDGKFLYVFRQGVLHKFGSGFGGTLKGELLQSQSVEGSGWIGVVQGNLYVHRSTPLTCEFLKVDTETLKVKEVIELHENGRNAFFSDGDSLGLITSSKDDSFVIRMYKPSSSGLSCTTELNLKLARKCVQVFGSGMFSEDAGNHMLNMGSDEDPVSIMCGKDFALARTSPGKILYTGKAQSLGIKQGGPPFGKWAELTVTKAPKMVDCSVGHDGLHALLVAEDGSVFFVGMARRGEDGDQGKGRRQPKPTKPKKMFKLEGQCVVSSACNNGTSAVVTRDGELYMFGKDATHAEHATGLMADLKEVTQVSLGKAHAVAITLEGHVYTFGINHKGQCGREFTHSGAKEVPTLPLALSAPSGVGTASGGTMGEEEDEELESEDPEVVCPPGKHRWKHNHCMVCTVCGECTGYGPSCIASGRPDRNPGLPCGCGAGDSGCEECGCCRSCAREEDYEAEVAAAWAAPGDAAGAAPPPALLDNKQADIIIFDMRYGGRAGARLEDKLRRRIEEYRTHHRRKQAIHAIKAGVLKGASGVVLGPSSIPPLPFRAALGADLPHKAPSGALLTDDAVGSDHEREASKLTSLPPARLCLPCDSPVIQAACGMHHTVLLLQNGQVYTFGSNQHGQLGQGDLLLRGTPSLVLMPSPVTQVAAGSNHTVMLTATGQVYTCGNYQKGQLGRGPGAEEGRRRGNRDAGPWHACPGAVPGIEVKQGRRATWVGASGDHTFVKLDEFLTSASSLAQCSVVANKNCIGVIPKDTEQVSKFKCLMINKADGTCRGFNSAEQMDFKNHATSFDSVYNILWSLNQRTHEVSYYSVIAGEAIPLSTSLEGLEPPVYRLPGPLGPELCVPGVAGHPVGRSQAALYLLACLDVLTAAQERELRVRDDEQARHQGLSRAHAREDFSAVNRFESHGGGWGYSGHSIEAIRFMTDTDILLGGFGLFGGRGEYTAKLRLFDIGVEGGEQETDGELLAETEEMPYECGARHKYPMLFEEPIPLQANRWYVAWARISGPSSDCGSGGQSIVTTEDQVVFYFRSSMKSNNGTDINAGQLPQLLYRVITPDIQSSSRPSEHSEPVLILSNRFSKTVTPECFHSLLRLLRWSWQSFKGGLCDAMEGVGSADRALLLDLGRLLYICAASLHLLRIYINEVYTAGPFAKKMTPESQRVAECIADARTLLQLILSDRGKISLADLSPTDSHHNCTDVDESGASLLETCVAMQATLLDECDMAFMSCYHAFYPSTTLKWRGLCDLLLTLGRQPCSSDTGTSDRLLAAVLASLCSPIVRLVSLLPPCLDRDVRPSEGTSSGGANSSPSPETPVSAGGDLVPTDLIVVQDYAPDSSMLYPVLVDTMNRRTDKEGRRPGPCSFREVLQCLLDIVVGPVHSILKNEPLKHSKKLVSSTCAFLSAVVAELSSQTIGCVVDVQRATRQALHCTPSRFTRVSQNRTWNTGNGSPDAICFSVDRSNILLAGVCIYGGVGNEWHYELELLDDSGSGGDPSHTQRWKTLDVTRGTFGPEDCYGDVAELKFDRPIPIKENVKYALRLRNHGARTNNGDGGLTQVKGPDGTLFTYSDCSLSFNGTNHTRGQIPQILYYSTPLDTESQQASRDLAELQARRNALSICSAIVKASAQLLSEAVAKEDDKIVQGVGSSLLMTQLLPLVLAHLCPMASTDARSAVEVLDMVQKLLKWVAVLNQRSKAPIGDSSMPADPSQEGSERVHYAVVESDHPYKPSTVSVYKVKFPPTVRWMALEFDPRCGTAQAEDCLHLYITNGSKGQRPSVPADDRADEDDEESSPYWPVLRKFGGSMDWPSTATIVPGNEVVFSLETASDYVKDEKANNYGFRCQVTGYEGMANCGTTPSSCPSEGLKHLEKELAYLGGMCAASLLRRDLILPAVSSSEVEEDLDLVDYLAHQVFDSHSMLLSRGFALAHPPTIQQALEGMLPFSDQSNERPFLRDFVACNPGTSGGRLARWLQPESYVDPKQCELVCSQEELKCGWPSVITVVTKDQYSKVVRVPNMKVEVRAVPMNTYNKDGLSSPCRKLSHQSKTDGGCLTFGGHPAPALDIPYEVTIKDKMLYHAISVMKPYEEYSFEELRFVSPTKKRLIETMLVRANNDGTYTANWTPGSVGWYLLHATIDSFEIGSSQCHLVEVKEPPHGLVIPTRSFSQKSSHQPNKTRKFFAKFSAGLRIRSHPSLQSKQIGVIQVNGTVTFIDELHNDDGVWVRLSPETIKTYCQNGYSEAWCLQYNQHIGKTLLIPIEEPKSVLEEFFSDKVTLKKKEETKLIRRGPGLYHVVRCGASGHNVRSKPNLKAPPVGMLVLGNTVTAVEDISNADGVWLRLSRDSMKHYCFSSDGEAWSLARNASSVEVVYLRHESEVMQSDESDEDGFKGTSRSRSQRASEDGVTSSAAPASKGYDFGSIAPSSGMQAPLQLCGSGSPSIFTFGSGTSDQEGGSSGSASPFIFGSPASTPSTSMNTLTEPEHTKYSDHLDSLTSSSSANVCPHRSPTSRPRRQVGTSPPVAAASPPRAIPPELRGVSVRELVRAIGESRANGNGVTPPHTPPSTPPVRRRGSSASTEMARSSSPVPIPGSSPVPSSYSDSVMGRSDSGGSPMMSGSGVVLRDNWSESGGYKRRGSSPRRASIQSAGSVSSLGSFFRELRDTSATGCIGCITQRTTDSPISTPGTPKKECLSPNPSSKSFAQTGTQTSPETGVRGHFSIGSGGRGDESPRASSKLSRRSPAASGRHTLRTKRDRPHSPAETAQCSTPAEVVHEAMSPSVAECLRAVFAALLWHEGVVHDAMACASFLKFNPELPKMGQGSRRGVVTSSAAAPLTKEQKARFRHSVEVSSPGLLHLQKLELLPQHEQLNENVKRTFVPVEGVPQAPAPVAGTEGTGSELPRSLQLLVVLWEQISGACMRAIGQQLVLPSPLASSKTFQRLERARGVDRRRTKKKRELRSSIIASRAGQLSEANSGETMCELCGTLCPHPVTYHMRQAHPGCGDHAGGKGYNSAGLFCGGWAGNCGDGGVASSSWYLVCDRCREKFLRQKQQKNSHPRATATAHRRSVAVTAARVLSPMQGDVHHNMKHNALFLLELSSSATTSRSRRSGGLPSLLEKEGGVTSNPFLIPGQFQCLDALGVPKVGSQYIFGEEYVVGESSAVSVTTPEPDFETFALTNGNEAAEDSVLTERSNEAGCSRAHGNGTGSRAFHRSVSVGLTHLDWIQKDSVEAAPEARARVVPRKRNNSSGSEGMSSILCQPSAVLTKLVSAESNRAAVDLVMQRPVMVFVLQRHDLDSLQLAIQQALRKASCRVYAMQAFNWLLRNVTQLTSLHDLLWCFVAATSPAPPCPDRSDEELPEQKEEASRKKDLAELDKEATCEHPLSDLALAGEACCGPLRESFHTLLQTVSDLLVFLPPCSALQQMAMQCWRLRFHQSDHAFLHRSHVFSSISRILSHSEEAAAVQDDSPDSAVHPESEQMSSASIEVLKDVTAVTEIKASSRQAMVNSLTDNTTETFWESGDEDRNKTKVLTLTCSNLVRPRMVCVHVDNCRDLANKVSTITFKSGLNSEELRKLKQVEVESRYTGWASCVVPDPNHGVLRLELRGPDNSLRLRQLKVLGHQPGIAQGLAGNAELPAGDCCSARIQQKNCEAETLRVFRLLTAQVFGKLLGEEVESPEKEVQAEMSAATSPERLDTSNDLKEHMVGILFSRSKLTHLQKQVCSHIVSAIKKETSRVRDEWESALLGGGTSGANRGAAPGSPTSRGGGRESTPADTYCFEMLSMVLALSGSAVGRAYLSQQAGLLRDLFSLLHTGSARVQRQVTSLLRRVLPEVPPPVLANVLQVGGLPPMDYGITPGTSATAAAPPLDMERVGLLDVLLGCIAKALHVLTKVRGGRGVTGSSLSSGVCTSRPSARWWLRGSVSPMLAQGIIQLLRDMAGGKLTEPWAKVTKAAIAESILNFTKLDEKYRTPTECLKTPTLWLALASLCVLDQDHVERLSSGQWVRGRSDGLQPQPRPTCDNHDDGETPAIISCNVCGNVCADCDRFLHLHRRTKSHQRQVFKEEEEAIKVDLHEGCGRTKLFWVMALADSKTLKAIVEFREGAKGKTTSSSSSSSSNNATCRFCGALANAGLLSLGNVCSDCQEHAANACSKVHPCGHMCGGIKGETTCLPCLHGCGNPQGLRQDADDMCMICFSEALSCAPAIQLTCGHVFHHHCCRTVLSKSWTGPRITFGFSLCPICKASMAHHVLRGLLEPIKVLYEDVRRKALMRLEYEGLHRTEAITVSGGRFHNDPAGFAMERYAYYVCYKCKKAYYGGEVRCDIEAGPIDEYDPTELVCGACSDVSRAQMCPKHGTDFLEYKCRYCCSVAVFFCFGTTHFCNACHDDFQRVANLPKHELPHCPAGPKAKQLEGEECPLHVKHPPTGEEFALGCGVCRNAHTF
ncbi:E3 ubiquitin-protein ligase MYCBP2-like [Ornithodoros turicata]|uniref:E3 ubiquitin-protein ligase MYCBP2-like n=1 Tax=Ornithodoros turicata TaxID=34597 RepID=UPI00313A24D9